MTLSSSRSRSKRRVRFTDAAIPQDKEVTFDPQDKNSPFQEMKRSRHSKMNSAISLEQISALIDSEMDIFTSSNITPMSTHSKLKSRHERKKTHPLLAAARMGSLLEIEHILSAENEDAVDIEITDSLGWTALVKCAVVGDVQTCRMLIDKHKANVDHVTDNGCTPLHYAILRQHIKVVILLIEKGCDIHAKDAMSGWTPLHTCVFKSHLKIAEHLLICGADPYTTDETGKTAIDRAIDADDESMVNLLKGGKEYAIKEFEERKIRKLKNITLKSIFSDKPYEHSSSSSDEQIDSSVVIVTPPMSAISGWSNFKSDIFNMKAPSHIEQFSTYMDIDFSLDMTDIENMNVEFDNLMINNNVPVHNELRHKYSGVTVGSGSYRSRGNTADMVYRPRGDTADTINDFNLHCMDMGIEYDGSVINEDYDGSVINEDYEDEESVTVYHTYKNESNQYLDRLAEDIMNDTSTLNTIRDSLDLNQIRSNSSSDESFIDDEENIEIKNLKKNKKRKNNQNEKKVVSKKSKKVDQKENKSGKGKQKKKKNGKINKKSVKKKNEENLQKKSKKIKKKNSGKEGKKKKNSGKEGKKKKAKKAKK